MALLTNAIKGTQDTLPQDSYKIRFVEQTMSDIAQNFGFREIRTPVFEHTELFNRSVGDTTDVVQKEMYTFEDKGGRSVTLRPEGTAGAVRAFLEHGLFNDALPQKMYYFNSCYRYEKPQAGRLREFHQFGVECFGAESPAADAEIIALATEIFGFLGVEGLELRINSIGCPICRAEYQKALKAYFTERRSELCDTCGDRLERNPMRILDCKNPECAEIAKGAPVVLDFLCDDCKVHFESLKSYLEAMHIPYRVDPTIVRGLDYYTRTVFEFVTTEIGAQGTVCGGGRYDGLCEELGGNHIPALGFGLGLERLMLLLETQGVELPGDSKCNIYIAPAGDRAKLFAAELANSLRQEGIFALFDISDRGIKAQMKYANKIGAEYVVVIGDDEMDSGKAKLKDMETGDEREVELSTLADDFAELVIQDSLAKFDLGDDIESLFGGKE
ncbi:MAG: histidine--tRNA ligase [Clostridia bacterium]|nr:histidine--tRNA ligase [Clostridia bacterium]MBR5991936.1 histidine--tRNA ligase [Clostridia bacterium]MBR6512362.1 histidine--tRNA ligase [Clostridia bacterium]